MTPALVVLPFFSSLFQPPARFILLVGSWSRRNFSQPAVTAVGARRGSSSSASAAPSVTWRAPTPGLYHWARPSPGTNRPAVPSNGPIGNH